MSIMAVQWICSLEVFSVGRSCSRAALRKNQQICFLRDPIHDFEKAYGILSSRPTQITLIEEWARRRVNVRGESIIFALFIYLDAAKMERCFMLFNILACWRVWFMPTEA